MTSRERRTVLQHLMEQRRLTREETLARLHKRAQALRVDDFALSLRQFDRWLAGQVDTLPRPGTCRVVEEEFGRRIEDLLAIASGEGDADGEAADVGMSLASSPGHATTLADEPAAGRKRAAVLDGALRRTPVAWHPGDNSFAWPAALVHLPPDTDDFTGRSEQVSQVIKLVTTAADTSRTATPIVAISGKAGVGKTTLAIHVGHKVSGAFPDGQMYTNLRGAEPQPCDPGDVLAGFLRELGVAGQDIPEGLDERARMYRARLAGRRVLVVLDNAASETQVRPLLPGSPGCAVLITGRIRMAVLAGSHLVSLDVMPPAQAAALLTSIIGAARVATEPHAVEEIAELCGYLPLALRIAAARLVSRREWRVSLLASRLRDAGRRLDVLKAGDLEVRASFALSYESRGEDEQAAFRMLGLLASDFPAWNLAALAGADADQAEQLLEQLVDAELLEVVGVDATGLIRYRLHDLLRDFARERLAEAEPKEHRKDALSRLADQYVAAAKLAADLQRRASGNDADGEDGSGENSALLCGGVVRGNPRGWLLAERANLTALAAQAHAAGLVHHSWRLAEELAVIFDWRADWRAWEQTHKLALDDARQAGDEHAEARILCGLGALQRERGHYDDAVAMLTKSSAMLWRLGDERNWAEAMRNLGDTYRYQGQLAAAIEAFTAAITVFETIPDERQTAAALNGLGDTKRGLSQFDQAARHFEAANAIYDDLGDELELARTQVRHALVFRDQNLTGQATSLITAALSAFRQLGDRRWEARALRHLAVLQRNDGHVSAAMQLFSQCLAIFDDLSDHRAMAVTYRNKGDAHRLLGSWWQAEVDLSNALKIFTAISDRRWTARTHLSMAAMRRARRHWDPAANHAKIALEVFRAIGDRPAEAKTLREQGMAALDKGELREAEDLFTASQKIFEELGDDLWTARVLACKARLAKIGNQDPSPFMDAASELCRKVGISEPGQVAALREW